MGNARKMHDPVMFPSLARPCVTVTSVRGLLSIGRGDDDVTGRRVWSGGVMGDVIVVGGVNMSWQGGGGAFGRREEASFTAFQKNEDAYLWKLCLMSYLHTTAEFVFFCIQHTTTTSAIIILYQLLLLLLLRLLLPPVQQ